MGPKLAGTDFWMLDADIGAHLRDSGCAEIILSDIACGHDAKFILLKNAKKSASSPNPYSTVTEISAHSDPRQIH
jgi:hypothetical protein